MNTAKTYPVVMVIDDDAFMRKLIATQLRALGCKSVLCHECGRDALSALAQQVIKVPLILCDLQMPGMDGIEVLRGLAKMKYRGGLVLVTGEDSVTLTMAQKLASAHGLNVLGTLSKPVQSDLLQNILSRTGPQLPAHMTCASTPSFTAAELAQGIAQGQLVSHFQPKVSLRSGRVVGLEALVRWQHPEAGLIYPDAFIHLAEESGLIDAVTRAVLVGSGGALGHLKRWSYSGLDLHLAVNVSMISLHDLGFPDLLTQLALDAGVRLDQVVLEITESRLNMDMRSVVDVLTRLRLRRMRLSIDDFGTGYSSLAQLNELPFDELKIDRRFVHQAHSDPALESILGASINIGHDLGMEVTGEGVETEEDWLHLQRRGCDVAQGFWICKPMEVDAVPHWVRRWNDHANGLPGIAAVPHARQW